MPEPLLSLGGVFTLLFVTLGPLKVFGPFAQLTRDADERVARSVALRAFGLGLIGAVAGALIGQGLFASWGIEIPALQLAGGIVFLIVGLRLVLEQYEPARELPPPVDLSAPMAAALRLTFPTLLTPYGIAALVIMLANAHDGARRGGIVAIVVGVLLLDLLAMLFARRIMRSGATVMALQVLGAVLGVLQIGLAVEMMVRAMRDLGMFAA
jgi:multiple antibiotic resistance protein